MKVAILVVAALALSALGSYATTHNNTIGGTNGLPDYLGQRVHVVSQSVDLSTYTNTVGTGDYIKMINVPAGTVLLGMTYQLSTVCTNSTTFDVGDSGSATRFVSNKAANSGTTETLYATPLLKTSTDYVAIHADAALGHTGVIKVKAFMVDVD